MSGQAGFKYHQYHIVGRKTPSEKEPEPPVYRMKVWASNDVRAKSKFWYFLRKLKKVKKSNGQILSVNEIHEKRPTKPKNYAIWIRYISRSGTHNMYKEFRDVTLNGAIDQLYNDMAGRHRVRPPEIQIIKTAIVPPHKCVRKQTKQFHSNNISFPLTHKVIRPDSKSMRATFRYKKPTTAMQ